MSVDLTSRPGLQGYLQDIDIEELRRIASEMKVDIENLPGKSREEKAQELIAYLDRRHQFTELSMITMRHFVEKRLQDNEPIEGLSLTTDWNSQLSGLNLQLNSLQSQIDDVQKAVPSANALATRLEEISRTVSTANTTAKKLSAEVLLPPQDVMAVRLVPVHQLQRLEEYRSDANLVSLISGALLGATFGVVVNWFTGASPSFAPLSIVFVIVMGLLLVTSLIWNWKLHQRAKNVTKEMLIGSITNQPDQ